MFTNARLQSIAKHLVLASRSGSSRVRATSLRRHLDATPAEVPGSGTVLVWAPEAGVEPHIACLIAVARAIQDAGTPVVVARCYNLFERCPVMDMYGFASPMREPDRVRVCGLCLMSSIDRVDSAGIPSVDLRPYAPTSLRQEISDVVDELDVASLFDLTYDGVEVGRVALHDLALLNKWSEFDHLNPNEVDSWRAQVRSTILAVRIVDDLCSTGQIDRIIHYNDYSLMVAARLAASRHGVPTTTVMQPSHLNIDRSRMILMPEVGRPFRAGQRNAWPRWRELHLRNDQVADAGQDILLKLMNVGAHSHIYSAGKSSYDGDLRSTLRLSADRPTLVAYTSSLDEEVATKFHLDALGERYDGRMTPFEDQIAWLSALVDHADATDLNLVVRVHPREGVNQREQVRSQHLVTLRERFDRPFANARFIWPEDPTSSYDLAEIADVALVAWSSIAVELARLGIPVLACSDHIGPFPDDDFVCAASSTTRFFALLDKLLRSEPSLERIRLAYRWYWQYFLGTSIDIGDDLARNGAFRTIPHSCRPPKIRNEQLVAELALGQRDVRSVNLDAQIAAQTSDGFAAETRALLAQITQTLIVATGLGTPVDDARLDVDESGRTAKLHRPGKPTASISIVGQQMTMDDGSGHHVVRHSPLVCRLLLAAAEAVSIIGHSSKASE